MAAAVASAGPLLATTVRSGVPAAAAALPAAARLWGSSGAGYATAASSAHGVAQQVLAANQHDVGPEVIEAVAALEPSVRPLPQPSRLCRCLGRVCVAWVGTSALF